MKYNFDEYKLRNNMEAAKWDSMGPNAKEGIVPLSVADMELLSPPEIINELVKTAEFGMYGYTWWGERYANAVQHWMKTRHDWDIQKDWIVQLNGVVQGLACACRAFTEPGDNILLLTPIYYPFYTVIARNKRTLVESTVQLKDGHYEIDFEDFEEKAKTAKMFMLCNPHNPLGRVWTEEELRKIGDICRKYNVLVVSDEIHFDLIMPGHKHTVYAALGEEYADNCVILNAPSKTFSLAALCLANAFIPNKELREKFDFEVNNSGAYTYSIFGIRALEVGYTECADWVDQLNEHLYGNYQYFKNFMKEKYPEVWVADLEGTYLVWFDCKCFGLDGKTLGEYLRNEASLYLDDGYIFGDIGDGFERINIACTRQVLVDALDRFDKAMQRLKNNA